jgi:hypothetical protein
MISLASFHNYSGQRQTGHVKWPVVRDVGGVRPETNAERPPAKGLSSRQTGAPRA